LDGKNGLADTVIVEIEAQDALPVHADQLDAPEGSAVAVGEVGKPLRLGNAVLTLMRLQNIENGFGR
jgi:hypothetical protein